MPAEDPDNVAPLPTNRTHGGVADYIDIVFDGPPSHDGGRLIEVESPAGIGLAIGQWIQDGELWRLRITLNDILRAMRAPRD